MGDNYRKVEPLKDVQNANNTTYDKENQYDETKKEEKLDFLPFFSKAMDDIDDKKKNKVNKKREINDMLDNNFEDQINLMNKYKKR